MFTPATFLRTVILLAAAGAAACGAPPYGAAEDQETAAPHSPGSGELTPAGWKDDLIRRYLSADLQPEGRLRFYARGNGTIGVQIDVKNVGNLWVTAPSSRTRLNGNDYTTPLYPYAGTPTSPANAVAPGGRGYLLAILPAGALAACRTYSVAIDRDRAVQAGLPDPFANDVSTAATQCLTWTTPITSVALESVQPDPLIANKTIQSIVSSIEIGRADDRRCSYCHYAGSGRPYSPNVTRDHWALVGPQDVISGKTWAEAGGWGDRFIGLTNAKPYHLRSMFTTWKSHGAN